MKTIKQLITYLRNRDYSQTRIARIAGVSQMSISRWERVSPKHASSVIYDKLEAEVQLWKTGPRPKRGK